MKKFLVIIIAVAVFVFFFVGMPDVQGGRCPDPTPKSPAPTVVVPGTGDTNCLYQIREKFYKGNTETEIIRLEKGKNYWFGARGCPRAGNIKISITKGNKTLVESTSYAPGFCFTPKVSGGYAFRVKLKSTKHGSRWGNVNACAFELKNASCVNIVKK